MDTVFNREVLKDGEYGLLWKKTWMTCRRNRSQSMVMKSLLNRIVISQGDRITERYTWEHITDQYEEVFRKFEAWKEISTGYGHCCVKKKVRSALKPSGTFLAGTVVLLHMIRRVRKARADLWHNLYSLSGQHPALALLHRRLEERIPEISVYYFVIEGIVLFITGF
jgi:hypothetical protein